MKFFVVSFLISVFSLAANAVDKVSPKSSNVAEAKGIAKVMVQWTKDKGEKFDFRIAITNEKTDKAIIVLLSDIGCKRGNISGTVKHTFFNTGERTMDFMPNESKEFTLVCYTPSTKTGKFSLTIGKIYENPNKDGKTLGPVLAENLTWTR